MFLSTSLETLCLAVMADSSPMCYRAMRAVLGCSMDLLASVAGTKKAKSTPFCHKRTRVGRVSFVRIFSVRFIIKKFITFWGSFTSNHLFIGIPLKGALYNRSDCVETFLHGLIDQLCEVQSDSGINFQQNICYVCFILLKCSHLQMYLYAVQRR